MADTSNPAGEAMREALTKINAIRNSIIGLQTMNWSEHIYPLVAALEAAGFEGMDYPEARENFGTMLERTSAAEDALTTLRADHAAEVARKDAEIADLRGAMEDTKAAADDLAQVCLDEHDSKAAGAFQFISGFISDRFAALANPEPSHD